MPTPGLVMRLAQSQADAATPPTISVLAPPEACPGAEAIYQLNCTDEKEPQYNTFYFVRDIEPLLSSNVLYAADAEKHKGDFASVSWVVLSFVNGRAPGATGNSKANPTPTSAPPLGTIVVANGSTPRPDMQADYNAWYDEEHGGKLTRVPGWQMMRRYKLEKVCGDVETAGFYGVNFYDEVNGLGGPEWKEGVTEWTLRIRDQAAKPNIRRTWKVAEVVSL